MTKLTKKDLSLSVLSFFSQYTRTLTGAYDIPHYRSRVWNSLAKGLNDRLTADRKEPTLHNALALSIRQVSQIPRLGSKCIGAWNDFLIRYGLRSEMTDADIEVYLMQDSICDHNCGCRYEHPQSSDTDFRSAIDCLLSMGYVVTLSKPFNNEEYAL